MITPRPSTGYPYMDSDFAVKLAVDGTEIELPDGEKGIVTENPDVLRCVVYNNEIQRVRNPETFLAYHTKNPGSLKKLMSNIVWALNIEEDRLSHMYNKSLVNRQFTIPLYMSPTAGVTKQNGVYYANSSSHAHGYAVLGHLNSVFRHVPVYSMILYTLNWLKGIAVETYGVDAFQLIKEAENEGLQRRYDELMTVSEIKKQVEKAAKEMIQGM